MPDTGFIAIFILGLLSSGHCIGMCGGIVGALSNVIRMPGDKIIRQWPLHLAYNLGRITTYIALGAVMGAIGELGLLFNDVFPVQRLLYILANVMLIAMGLYLTGFTRILAPIERTGQRLWQHIRPATARFLPARSIFQAYPLGLLWGFLPCGMVYSVLNTALVSGSAERGALVMLAFGLGTLPALLAAGLSFKKLISHPHIRLIGGLIIIGFGVFGLLHVHDMQNSLMKGMVC